MQSVYLFISLALAALNIGCSSIGLGSSKSVEPVVKPVEPAPTQMHQEVSPVRANPVAEIPKKDDELYLQQARIMAKMSEIEAELKLQREKIRLLEQGLLTGIAPDDLKMPRRPKSSSKLETDSQLQDGAASEGLSKPNLDAIAPKAESMPGEKSNNPEQGSDQKNAGITVKLKLVENLYQASKFGAAINELAAVSREHGENAGDGKIRLWLGKCYSRLNELTTARTELEAYVKAWPSSANIADARLELARVYARLGLKERARGELQRVMKDFEGQEFSEIASAEFSKLQGGL